MERHLIIEGGYNVRELGDYPTADGRKTRRKVLLRSGGLDQTSPIGQQQLRDYGVTTIVDIRDEWEVEKYPNPFSRSSDVRFVNVPLIGNTLHNDPTWRAGEENDEALDVFYAKCLVHCQPQIGAIITTIIESEGCTLFHCYAGKDRTGITAALLLGAMGVDATTITEDYALTEMHIQHLMPQWIKSAIEKGRDPKVYEKIYGAKAETMQALLGVLDETYGGTMSYLALCGVTGEQITRLHTRFVE